jgi:hypothetical protein
MPIIMPHSGHGALNDEVERVMRDWPVPSISRVEGTRLGGFTMAHYNSYVFDGEGKPKQFPPWQWEELFDHYLYLGPAASLRWSTRVLPIEPEFHGELQRRKDIVHSPGGIPRL